MSNLLVFTLTVLGGGILAGALIQRDAARSRARHTALTRPRPLSNVFVRLAAQVTEMQKAFTLTAKKMNDAMKQIR